MVNRSVAKRAKHAKPALRKGYWAKSSSSVLAVALAASLVPAVPALGDEFDADVSDIEATEPPAFDAPIPTEPSSTAIGRRRSTASLMPAIRELSPKAVAQKALGIERSARSMMRGFGKVLGRRRLPPPRYRKNLLDKGVQRHGFPRGLRTVGVTRTV